MRVRSDSQAFQGAAASAPPPVRHDSGMALFICLVLLLVMTVVGVSAVQTTTMEERMARNARDSMLSFQAAEAALRDGEAAVEAVATTALFTPAGTNALWAVADFGQESRWEVDGVWGGAGTRAADTAIAGVADAPRYMIEHLTTVELTDEASVQIESGYQDRPRVEIFRITAVGFGGTRDARTFLQSHYGRVLQ